MKQANLVSAADRLSWRWLLAFSALILLVHEGHELAHTVVGRLMCGEWAIRDFNSWRQHGCTSPTWVPSAMGPLFSLLVMLVGVWLAFSADQGRRWLALALIFAANPLARIITAVMGGGDEMVIAKIMAGVATRTPALHYTVAALVTVVFGVGLVAGWHATRGLRHRVATYLLVMWMPMLITGVLLFVVLNGALHRGVLATPVIGGAPALVQLATLVFVVLFAYSARWLTNPRRIEG